MKRVGGLWPRIVSFDNLLLAFRKARRGKRDRVEVARFELDLEPRLLRLQEELAGGHYRPGPYRLFDLYDRKPRRIAAAPFRDRVVHHALMNLVEPALDRTFIDDSYACRAGKGVHAAVARYQTWAQRYPYALKMDVRRYFPSIDHALLKAKLRRRLKEPDVLRLFDLIIDGAPPSDDPPLAFPGDDLVDLMERRRGLPIGNLTSQFLANLYLDDLDHFLKETCRVRAYLRYVDDLMVLGDDKTALWALRARIDDCLARERLVLHPPQGPRSPHGGRRRVAWLPGLSAPPARAPRQRLSLPPPAARPGGRLCAGETGTRRRAGQRPRLDRPRPPRRQRRLAPSGAEFGMLYAGGGSGAAPGGWFGAAAGTAYRRTSGRPTATGTPPMKRTTPWAFVSPGRPRSWPEPAGSRTRWVCPRVPMIHRPAHRREGVAEEIRRECPRPGLVGIAEGPGRPPFGAANPAMAAPLPRWPRASIWILLLALGLSSAPASAQEIAPPPPTQPANQVGLQATVERVAEIPPPRPAVPCTNEPGLGPEMILIEAGRFLMGSPANEPGRTDDEGPQREIVAVRPFALARCETTVAEFRAFVEATGRVTQAEAGDGCYALHEAGTEWTKQKGRSWRDPGFPQTDAHPVVCVSWNDAVAYAEWLSRRTGQTYRLPTEAEWEYVARAGSAASRFWGDDPNVGCDYANAADQVARQRFPNWTVMECDDGALYTAPVGRFKRNAFGLSDMLGNVWEWVRDCYAENLQSVPADGAAWEGQEGESCARRVVRGGGWSDGPGGVRSANRFRFAADEASGYLGFRLARDL